MSNQTRTRLGEGGAASWLTAVSSLVAALTLVATLAFSVPARAGDDDEPVKIRAAARQSSVPQGGRLVIAVVMDHAEHYHTWPAKDVKLPADIDEFAIRTEIAPASLPAWVSRVDGAQFPEAKPGKVPDVSGKNPTVEVPLYSNKAITYLRLEVRPDAPVGARSVDLKVSYQACNESMCMPPQDVSVSVTVNVVAAGSPAMENGAEAALFSGFDDKKWGSGGAVAVPPPTTPVTSKPPVAVTPVPNQPAPAAVTPPASAPAQGGGATIFGMAIGANIFILALASILGGFILNLTPCVLPVIPIKVMSLTQHAKTRRHALMLGLWMAAGVVAFWFVVGLPMAVISRQLDPSQYIFGIWWVCLSIGLIIAIMGLGIMGLFNLDLPQSVYMIETKADSPAGSFLFGVLTAVLGLPCFGFMAGGLLAAASTMPATSIMIIFTGIGVGMAAPYLVLSIWPQLLKFIPRTGPASQLVKEVMGVLLLAAAAYFVAAGIQVLLAEYPYLAGSMVWWATGFFIAIASLWLIVRTWQITKRTARRVAFTVLAFLMTAGIWVIAQGQTASDRQTFLDRKAAMAAAQQGGTLGDAPVGIWLEYTPELFSAVRASGRPIFLDFTASWCITCKALKRAILDPMRPEFKNRGVVIMEVDCSANSSAGSELLRSLGRTGVPTWAIYASGANKPRFVPVDKPSSGTVITELDAAGIITTLPKTTSAANDAKSPPR